MRESALHIRQASVYEDDVCRRSTGVGHIIIKNEAEAWDTFGASFVANTSTPKAC